MSNEIFRLAIEAFRHSQTGQGRAPVPGEPPPSARYADLAPRALQKLDDLLAANDIGFYNFPIVNGVRSSADSEAGRDGPDISIGEVYQPLHGVISVLLVHEACHLVIQRGDLDEETQCRTLAVLYYRELVEQGVSFDIGDVNHEFRMQPDVQSADLGKQLRYFRLNQLIDYTLHYAKYRKLLTPEWVHRGLSWWRGPGNRWLHTRGYYVRALTESPSAANAQDVVALLESVPRGQREKWNILWRAFMDDGGSPIRFRDTLAVLSGNHTFAQRVQALKLAWGDPLCPHPSHEFSPVSRRF